MRMWTSAIVGFLITCALIVAVAVPLMISAQEATTFTTTSTTSTTSTTTAARKKKS
jgi:hypothetical protein